MEIEEEAVTCRRTSLIQQPPGVQVDRELPGRQDIKETQRGAHPYSLLQRKRMLALWEKNHILFTKFFWASLIWEGRG